MATEHILIEETKKKCRIGEGCLYAVVSNSGYFIKRTNLEDDYGTDFEIKELIELNGKKHDVNTFFKIQLKTSSNWSINDDHILYDLDADAYNSIILHNQKGTTKIILVLMCLENESINWCLMDHTYIKFQNSLFWFYTDSELFTNNSSTKRIRIPITQVFNEESIKTLIEELQISIN